MAKLAFSKLGLKFNNEITNVFVNDFAIEVKNYIPANSKLELISNVINATADDNGFYNEGKLKVYFALEVIYAYTNLSFTDKNSFEVSSLPFSEFKNKVIVLSIGAM